MRSAGNLIAKLQKITHSDLNSQPQEPNQNFPKSFKLPQMTIPKLPARSREPIRNPKSGEKSLKNKQNSTNFPLW
jgi:hypothetical protein